MKLRALILAAVLAPSLFSATENLVGSIFSLSNANATTSMPWGMYFQAYDANNQPVAGNSGNVYYNVRLCLDYTLDPILNPSTQCTGGAVADLVANTAQTPVLTLAASGCTVSFPKCDGNWWQPVTLGAVNPNDGGNHLIYAWSISRSAATTSSTPITVATGTQTFTVPSGLTYSAGIHARATSSGTGAYMEGVVSSYSGTSLVIVVDTTSGSGSHSDWNITIGGYQLQNSPLPYKWNATAGTFTYGWNPATAPTSKINAGSLGIVVNLQDTYFSTGTAGAGTSAVCSCPASGQCGPTVPNLGTLIYDGTFGGIAGYYVSQYGVPCTNLVAISINPNSTTITGANFASALSTINSSTPANVQALGLAWNQPSEVVSTGATNSFRAMTGVVANGSAVNDPTPYTGNKCTAQNSAGYLTQGTQNPMFNTSSATPFASYGIRPTMMLIGAQCNGSCNNNQLVLPTAATVTAVTDNLDGTETLTLSAAQSGMATGFIRVNGQSGGCAPFNGRQAMTLVDSTHIKLNGSGCTAWTNSSGSLMQWYDDVATAKAIVDSARAALGSNPGTGKVYLAYTNDLGRIVYASQVSAAMTGTYTAGGHSASVSVLGTPASPLNSTSAVTSTNILFYGQASQHWTFSGSFLSGAGIASAVTSSSGMTMMDGNQTNPNVWIKNGAVGAVGTFQEPCGLTISKYIDWPLFLNFYLSGSTVIEAMWKSAQYPWDLNFVGNPLAAPFAIPLSPASSPSRFGNGTIVGSGVGDLMF